MDQPGKTVQLIEVDPVQLSSDCLAERVYLLVEEFLEGLAAKSETLVNLQVCVAISSHKLVNLDTAVGALACVKQSPGWIG